MQIAPFEIECGKRIDDSNPQPVAHHIANRNSAGSLRDHTPLDAHRRKCRVDLYPVWIGGWEANVRMSVENECVNTGSVIADSSVPSRRLRLITQALIRSNPTQLRVTSS
ncbi:hypothetical protein GCM10027419_23290 [Pandoraea terrae]